MNKHNVFHLANFRLLLNETENRDLIQAPLSMSNDCVRTELKQCNRYLIL